MADWMADVIRALGGSPSPAARKLLGAWQPWEGGHTNNSARFNWLNTTRGNQYPSINSVGVRAFPNYKTGVQMTAATLKNYPSLVRALRTGQVDFNQLAPDFNKWLTGKPTPGMSAYVRKIAGSFGQTLPAAPPERVAPPSLPPQGGLQALAGLLSEEAEMFNLAPPQALIHRLLTVDPQAELAAAKYGGTTRPPVDRRTKDIPGIAASDKLDPRVKNVLKIAHAQLGKPYVWAAASPEAGFDCSGLIEYAFEQAGIKTPGRLTTWTMAKLGKSVKGKELQPGDWVITNGGKHVVMYVGGDRVIAAPHRGEVVQYQPLSRFKGDIVDVRRFL